MKTEHLLPKSNSSTTVADSPAAACQNVPIDIHTDPIATFLNEANEAYERENRDLVQILGLEENKWLAEIASLAPLPARFKLRSQHTPAVLFALTCSVLASFLYVEGGKKYGPYSIAGSVIDNFTQNMLYNILTYFFITMPDRSWSRLIPAIGFAILATTPSTISTYDLSEENKREKAIFNALGNLFGNTFGMYTACNRFINYFTNNPQARSFLHSKLQNSLQNNLALHNGLEPVHSNTTLTTGNIVGVLMGVNLASAHTGYICNSSRYLEHLVGDPNSGIALGVLSMLPNITIALLLSGVDLGRTAVNDLADICQYLRGNKTITLSPREKKLVTSLVITIGISSWLALYSSATSKYLFHEKCDLEPTIGNTLNQFLTFTSDKGAILFNTIMSGIAIKCGFDFIKTAYAAPESTDKEVYKVAAMDKWITQAPIEKVEAITQTYFLEEEKEWRKPPSCFTRLRNRFFPHVDQSHYQSLNDAPSTESKHEPATNSI